MGRRALAAAVAILLSASARRAGAAEPEDGWLRGLQADVSADIAAGRPVVVEVHVPLCDNRVIRCGGRGLGDGGDLRRNLYWATSEGLAGWMSRRVGRRLPERLRPCTPPPPPGSGSC
jgi:hypothetical protein